MTPKELVDYTNLLTAKCPRCKDKIIRASHLSVEHGLGTLDPIELWDDRSKG